MKNEPFIENKGKECSPQPTRKPSAFLQVAEERSSRRVIRIALVRRECCMTRQAALAALREAELAEWQATGGDYLNSTHQPID